MRGKWGVWTWPNYTKWGTKYFFEFFFWQANPVFGGVAFFPIANSLLKVTFYLSKDYHFITFSDKLWTNIKWLSKENLLSGKRLPPQIQGWPARKNCQNKNSGLVWHIPQLLRATQPQNPRKVISKKYSYMHMGRINQDGYSARKCHFFCFFGG